jgi:hypothetical protein
MCRLPVRCCTDPSGAAYSNVQVFIRIRNDQWDLESTFQHVCLWHVMKMEAHCYYALCCVLVRLNTYVTRFTL